MRFRCPACNAVRSANERLLGREIKCPECGAPVQLPSASDIEAARVARENEKVRDRELARVRAELGRSLAQTVLVESNDPDRNEKRIASEEKALAAAHTDFTRPKPKQQEDMDMTPMVDVTFLLLIFFMITASFSVQKSIQRPAPSKEEPSQQVIQQEEDADTVTIQVDEYNAYNVLSVVGDRVASSKQDLIIALNDARNGAGSKPPTKIVIEAHENCIHAAVVAALDAGREANFESFEVTTVEQFD
ncbi:MAG: biopolymer transporter ExbD [Planctomycetales bacterium]|nr:biopolymer transporter ExbD [Planctomycetales bacterium]